MPFSHDEPIDQAVHNREWRDDRRLVLHELDRLNRGMDRMESKLDLRILAIEARVNTNASEVEALKTKASTWGAVGGAVVAVLVSWAGYIFHK